MKKILILFLLVACQPDKETKVYEIITRDSFPSSKKITGEIINIESLGLLNPFRFNIIRDSLLLVEEYTPDPYYFKIFNLKNNKKIVEFASRGKGPNEFLSGEYRSNIQDVSISNEIIIYDVVASKLSEYNIDSLVLNGVQKPNNEIKINNVIADISKFNNNTYINYNYFFLKGEKLKNDTEELFISSKDSLNLPDITNCKYFPANVSRKIMISSFNKKRIVTADMYAAKIEFYDENLHYLKGISGPELKIPEYELFMGNNVGFKKGKKFYGYTVGVPTANAIYLVYMGTEEYRFSKPKTLSNSEVFKLDWDGNLLCRYELDRFIYTISISSDEKYLYGTSLKSNGEKLLVKYNLFQDEN